MQANTSSVDFEMTTRGGSSNCIQSIFGVQCDEKFAEAVASKLKDLKIAWDDVEPVLDAVKLSHEVSDIDLATEIDKIYGSGVSDCIHSLNLQLSTALLCGCGKLGTTTSTYYPNLVCKTMSQECKRVRKHVYQDIQPNRLAQIIAKITGHLRLATDLNFIEMLGALAGYPFECGCGNPVTCLDSPLMMCDFCASEDGASIFTKHMDYVPGILGDSEDESIVGMASGHLPSNFISGLSDKVFGAANSVKDATARKIQGVYDHAAEGGSKVRSWITELITTVTSYFNSVFTHYGKHFFIGMKESFTDSIRQIAAKLKEVLGSKGFIFLFVAVVVAIIIKVGANLAANIIINTTLHLFQLMKDASSDVFGGFIDIYKSITDRLCDEKKEEEDFVTHSVSPDGCVAMIATLFCTFATVTGPLSCTNILRAISSARHVVSGVQVAQSALLWLVEKMPSALQSYLWDVVGLASFECDDSELMQVIVVMRESLLQLRKTPSKFLADFSACKVFLTTHTMLTRAVTKNLHGWNATQNSILRAMLAEAKEYVGGAQSCVDRHGGRIEPVGLILEGDPGIGKTALIEVLSAKFNPDVPRCARTYYKNLNERFWSGYSEQPVIVVDDFGAIRDAPNDLGLIADLLRIISPGEMALETPFQDKGTAYCNSSLLIMTTNRSMNAPQKAIESNKAFMRRFIYTTVTLKDEYKDRNGTLDTAKLNAKSIEERCCFPHLNFRVHERFKKDNSGSAGIFELSHQDRTFEELMTIINAAVLRKQQNAKFLGDAAEAVAPTTSATDLSVNLAKDVVAALDDHPKTALKACMPDIDDFTRHMATPTQEEEEHKYDTCVESSDQDSCDATQLLDAIEDNSHAVVHTYKHIRSKGGCRLGKKSRGRVKKQLNASASSKASDSESDLDDPTLDEFGQPYTSKDLGVRSLNYLLHHTTKYVKACSLKEHTANFQKRMRELAMEVLSEIKNHPFRTLAAVSATATTVAVCIKAFKMLTEPTQEPHMATKYNSNHIRRRPAVVHRPRYGPLVRHNLDSETDRAVINKVADNCGYVKRAGGQVGCMFVKGNVFRTVSHFFRTTATEDGWLPDGTPFSVFAREGGEMVEYQMSFSFDFVIPFTDGNGLVADWLYYNCGNKVPAKKDLVHMHVSEKLFTSRRDFRSVLLVKPDGVTRGSTAVVRQSANTHAVQYPSVDGMRKPDVYVPVAISSDYSCDHGDCGYPVIGKVDGQYKILSLHVGLRTRRFGAGDSTSAVVTIREVNECLEELEKVYPIVKHGLVHDVSESTPGVVLNDSYTYCGKLDWAPRGISSKTKFKRSLLYNNIEKQIFYEPSIMGDFNDPRTSKTPKEVLADIANRADASLAVMPKDLVMMAGDALFESVITQIPVDETTRIRTLTLEEALNGDGAMVARYPTAGSPGIPSTLNRKPGITGKHGIMDQDANGTWFISDPECAARIQCLHDSFSSGVAAFYVNQFCIKDETLKCDAAGNVKQTRGIKCAPIEANLCGKMYFGGMVSLFKCYYQCLPFKCGMNVFSSDWDDFIKWHLDIGDIGFDGDIGGQENIIKGEIYDELYRFTNRIYAHYGESPTDEEKRQRASYLSSLCHYYMVIGPDLFRAKFGNPSGNWLTSFICSFTSGILLGVAYFGLARIHDPMKANIYHFQSLVRVSLSGDDNFVSRSSLIEWFTGRNVSEFLATNYGYRYTDARKAAVFPEDRRVTELNFLACNTRQSDEYPTINYMACIDSGPLEKCVQYVSTKAGSGDEYIAIVDNVNTALDLVWTSGRDRFEEYRDKYMRAFIATPNCRVPYLHDFAFCEKRFLTKELLSEDYFGDDYLFVPQMLKAPEQVNPESEDAQVKVEVGPQGPADSQVTYQGTENTVIEPAKRFSVMYYSQEQKTPVPSYCESVSSAFVTREAAGDVRPMAGTLAWFAAPFAAWSGDLRIAVNCASEVLIRTDATERLANTANLPKQIQPSISGMSPFDYTTPTERWAMLQVPSTIPFKFNILPKLPGEEKYRQTTSASYCIDTPDGDTRARMTIFAAAGDNYSTHFLWMVPSIRIRGKYYPHNRNYEDTLPEYLKFVHTAGAVVFPLNQASVIENFKNQGVVDSDGTSVTSIVYRTEVFGDAELVALGVVTVAPTNRRYDPGAVREVPCDLQYCVARSVDIEVQPGGTTIGAVAYNLDPQVAIVRGTSYVTGTVEMSAGWYLTYQAYENPVVRATLNASGIPASEIVIPASQSGYEHSPLASYITPLTNSALGYLGGDYFIWDATVGFVKAFYNTPILPFEDEKSDYTFVKHMDSGHGIGFSNVIDTPVVTTDRTPRVARKNMGEEDYSFNSFVDRFQLIDSFSWNSSQTQGTILNTRSVPYQCIGSTTKTAFNKFCYWSGDVEIKVQVQSTAFVAGQLRVVFAPFCDPARASSLQLNSLVSISVAPNAVLMAGNTTEVTMLIPYAHYKNYLNTDGEAGDPFSLLGTVSIVVFNKLMVAVGGTDFCTVNVYSRFRNSDFQMLRPPPADGNVDVHGFIKHGAAMSMAKNVSGVVDDVTDAVSRVGAVAEYALDAPNVGVNYTPVFKRAAPMLNHSTNLQFCNVMDMHPGQKSLVDSQDVASSIPECTLKYLLTKPSYVNTFRIKDSDIVGEVYMVAPLTPTMKLFNAPGISMVDETLMGYVSAPFKYWRGGFKFVIEVIATSVHTARLVFATHYGGASSTVSMDNIMTQNAEILEIGAGRNTFEVKVPWRVPTQWLEVPAGPAEPVNPFEVTSSARYTMGEISIRLLTRLQTMPSVSPEIDCNVYVSMLDDAELAYIGMNSADLVPVMVPNQNIIP
jgi:hypothetical protein